MFLKQLITNHLMGDEIKEASVLTIPSSQLTPGMKQYQEAKRANPDCLIMLRMGDFYEMFFEDAKLASRVLNITLTTRDRNKENAVPMCGVPYHAANNYIAKLVKEGHKVAVCEQVEDLGTDLKSVPSAKGIVKREIMKLGFKPINKRPITPSENEIRENHRSRSAKLRVALKL